MSFLNIQNVKKSYGAVQVVKDFSLAIEKGEFISFLGPSGCGKTTVLRMVAGFETATSGNITVDGKDLTNLPASKRNVGMVFQAYALFPNLTVAGNVGFGLKIAGRSSSEIAARVKEMLEIIKLPHLADRYPYQLSGGQQQRVALARALAARPQVLLLDEPLSALDAKIRVSLREEIRNLQRQLGITTIFVTHDQEEALSISDRIVVMSEGIAQQIGTPQEIYNSPATPFVASFVGTLNVLQADVVNAASGELRAEGQRIITSRALPSSGNVKIALRPEAIRLGAQDGENVIAAVVEDVNFLGPVMRVKAKTGGAQVHFDLFNQPGVHPPQAGQDVQLRFRHEDVLVV
ncbi:ABC transporter ATP-binding protein [Methylovirgula sp. 4M-Z18]|uniref:ABC transporter ATP-binding protein n=1 Tax=Methylovirgula sp. 4M-Z18 TaxID=2293567 RepID=UPI000E2F018C|nr:ABC transporter ATP-binding protein [Methylovirgula sp. 4M-Z18]RFB79485.1 ABC transporter ATP-binding protein [Methylovirgula sp. 4M-Z18]